MKSNYERNKFISKFWSIAGPFLAVGLVLMFVIYSSGSDVVKILTVILALCIIIMTLILFFRSKNDIDRAYISIEKASDMMLDMVEGRETGMVSDLEEGSIGILYNNFGNLVNMFQEAKRREQDEKEYLRDVMSDISHQLKTPLASMEVFVELLLNDKVTSVEEQKQILEETGNQVTRMEWMVLSMLKLARIEAGAITFDIKDVDLKMVLEEVRSGTHYLTDSKNQKLIISCPDDVTVKADFDWLVEALINITKNASDYSDENDIEIEVEQNAVFTRIYIRDHGIGMTEETMTHIFDRFYRASNEVNPNSVGIGLSLSKSIVEGMGGKLSVDSKLGEGSCFKVQF
ncbi:MAG: HAMP domain-containing histidine kinase [Eubacterium sp.]|nr:HAMP domain-containing histidine kinase [Eubacterium sp.]